MWSWLGALFGSQKAGEALVDNIAKAADKLIYTSEEKAEDAAKARTEGFQVYMAWLESTSGSRLARRFIALIVTVPWALAQGTSWVLQAVAPFITGVEKIQTLQNGQVVEQLVMASDKWLAAANAMAANASANNSLVGVVLLFYFGGPAAVDAARGLVEKWVNRTPKKLETA